MHCRPSACCCRRLSKANRRVENIQWSIPAVTIPDEPRFGYRALMLDAARFFIPKENVLRIIDCMGMLKINTLHFHLTDDNGWRVEIKKYPRPDGSGCMESEPHGCSFLFPP